MHNGGGGGKSTSGSDSSSSSSAPSSTPSPLYHSSPSSSGSKSSGSLGGGGGGDVVYQPNVEGNGGIVGGVLVGVGDRAILGSVVAVVVGLVVVLFAGFELVAAGLGREDGEVEAFDSKLSMRVERALIASANSLKDRVSCICTGPRTERRAESFSCCVGCVGFSTEVTAA